MRKNQENDLEYPQEKLKIRNFTKEPQPALHPSRRLPQLQTLPLLN
jgi:hypothetical protein